MSFAAWGRSPNPALTRPVLCSRWNVSVTPLWTIVRSRRRGAAVSETLVETRKPVRKNLLVVRLCPLGSIVQQAPGRRLPFRTGEFVHFGEAKSHSPHEIGVITLCGLLTTESSNGRAVIGPRTSDGTLLRIRRPLGKSTTLSPSRRTDFSLTAVQR
jgi:hypothetical protein